jgi:mitogen-activated protein kinase organizer 1
MVLEEARDSVTSVDVKDEKILTGSVDGHVRCYDIRMGQLCVDDIQKSVTCVRFTEDCLAYLVASLDSTIRLMDVSSGSVLNTFSGHTNLKYRINATLLDNDAHIAGGSEDGSLFIWDLLTGEQQQKLLQHTAPVTSVSVHSKTSGLLTCSLDGTARLWNQ